MAGFLSSGAGLLGVVDNLGATEDSDSSATGDSTDSQTSDENRAVRFSYTFVYVLVVDSHRYQWHWLSDSLVV